MRSDGNRRKKPIRPIKPVLLVAAGLMLLGVGGWHRSRLEVVPTQAPRHHARQHGDGDQPKEVFHDALRSEFIDNSASPVSSQTPAASVLAASNEFSVWVDAYRAAEGPVARDALLPQGEALARSRRQSLKQLIRSDPRQALTLAVPDQVRSRLPAAVQRQLEERIQGRGDLKVTITCSFGQAGHKDEVAREATIGDWTYEAFVHGRRQYQRSQKDVPLEGIAIDQFMAVQDDAGSSAGSRGPAVGSNPGRNWPTAGDVGGGSGHEERPPAANSSYTQGTKRLLFMRVAFPDDPSEPISESAATALMDQVNQIYVAYSYNTTAIITDVTPLLMLPKTKAAYSSLTRQNLETDARAAALAAGYDTANYDLDIVRNNQISGSNFAFAGQATVGGKGCVLQSSVLYVAVHELGHNYGLWHANYWNASGDSIIGPGNVAEYGNTFDTMASQNPDPASYEFNAEFKNELQWLPSSFVHTITNSGVYRVYAYDVPGLIGGQKYALRVKKDYARDYWAEYRKKLVGNTWTQSGILLNWSPFDTFVGDSLGGTTLLDTTPGTPAGKDDAPVVIGRTFSDSAAGLHITPIANGTSGMDNWIDVRVNLGSFVGNAVPSLSILPDQTSVATGIPVGFTATASDGDGDTLAYYWDFGDQTFGTNAATASKSWSAVGEYVVRCTVSDMKGGVANRSVVITVGSPATFRVSGQVTAGGQQLEGVRIHNGGSGSSYRGVYTDSAGNYTLANLSAGSFTLSAVKYGYTLSASGFVNPVSVGPNLTGQNWTADTGPVLGVTAADPAAAESGPDTGTFTVTRSGSLTSAITLKFNLSGGATYATDYSLSPTPSLSSSYQLTLGAGVASVNITLTPASDGLTEGPEAAVLTLFEDSAYTLGAYSEATVMITDSQAPGTPTVNVMAQDDAAPESGSDSGVFRFTRSNVGTVDLTIQYVVSGTAGGGVDYTSLSGTATIPAGETSVQVPFTVLDDPDVEANETVIVTTSANAAYSIGAQASATVTIVDDDPPTVTITATDNAAAEGGDGGTFAVTRTGSRAANLVVNYTMGGTATAGADYSSPAGTITIPAGQSTANFNLSPLNDSLVEGNETAVAIVTSSPVYNVGNAGTATVVVSDDDTPSITLAATDASAAESGPDAGTFRFTRTGSTAAPVTVYFVISGSAFLGADYSLTGTNSSGYTNSVVIPGGSSTADVIVTPVDDAIKESSEAVQFTLQNSPNSAYSVSTTTPQTVTITDNDSGGLVGVSFSPTASSNAEGDVFIVSVTATLSSPAPSGGVAFSYTVSNGSATSPGDYVFDPPGFKLIPPGGTSLSFIAFAQNEDATPEANETVIVTLASPLLCALDNANTVFTYTIIDDDGGSGTVSVSATDASASETGPNTGTFRVSRSGTTTSDLIVNFQVTGTASSPSDYASLGNSATIPAGSSFVDLTVAPVDDSTPEASETVFIDLLSVSDGTIGASKTATIAVADNDQGSAPPVVSIAATDATASEPGGNTGTFTVSRTGSTAAPLTVHFTVGGTAVSGSDYTAIGTSVTLPGGAASAPVVVTPLSDALTENDETVIVTLTVQGDYQAHPGASTATLAIQDAAGGNNAPVAATDSIQRWPTNKVKVAVVTLLSNDTDADLDPISLSSVSGTSAQGGGILLSNGWVYYTPPPAFTNPDSFTYAITDGKSAPVNGTVNVLIGVDLAASQNVLTTDLGNGSYRVRFDGIAGRPYHIEYAEAATPTLWNSLGTATASSSGIFVITNTPPGGTPQRLYRAIHP